MPQPPNERRISYRKIVLDNQRIAEPKGTFFTLQINRVAPRSMKCGSNSFSVCVSTRSAREGLLAGRRRGLSGGDAELRMPGMSSPVYSLGRFTPAGQGAITSPSPSSLQCPPHYKRVKLRGDLIRSSLHHRQSPLACQAALLIH